MCTGTSVAIKLSNDRYIYNFVFNISMGSSFFYNYSEILLLLYYCDVLRQYDLLLTK